jgi:hypothetical protein
MTDGQPDLVAHTLEQLRSLFAEHTAGRDRRFDLACAAVSGLAGRSMSPADVALQAVQIADETLKALGTAKK